MTLSEALAERVREQLDAEGWSQREFAAKLGVSQGAVHYLLWNKRRATGFAYYEKIAAVLGVKLSDLLRDLETRVASAPERCPTCQGTGWIRR